MQQRALWPLSDSIPAEKQVTKSSRDDVMQTTVMTWCAHKVLAQRVITAQWLGMIRPTLHLLQTLARQSRHQNCIPTTSSYMY